MEYFTTLEHLHAEMVKELVKPGEDILEGLTPGAVHIVHMAMGIAGEAGEIIDAVKKAAIYNKDLDIPNMIEELGDIEFYLEGLRQQLSISRDWTLQENIAKLRKRYGKRYSDQAAIARADKVDS